MTLTVQAPRVNVTETYNFKSSHRNLKGVNNTKFSASKNKCVVYNKWVHHRRPLDPTTLFGIFLLEVVVVGNARPFMPPSPSPHYNKHLGPASLVSLPHGDLICF